MRIKKVPCLAWVTKSAFPENVGLVVEVLHRVDDHPITGQPSWKCHSDKGHRCANRNNDEPLPGKYHDFTVRDCNLTPINDPDIKLDDEEETISPPVVERNEWGFPREKEHA